MARLSLGFLALLVAAIPAMTRSLVINTEEVTQRIAEEDNTLWHTAFTDDLSANEEDSRTLPGSRRPRKLPADQDPSVKWILVVAGDVRMGHEVRLLRYVGQSTGGKHCQAGSAEWLHEGRSRGQGSDNQTQAVSDRDYLNGLVEASVANVDNQEVGIAFVKTHKTGSTTMGSLLYRYAFRHGVKLAKFKRATEVDLESVVDQVENGEFERVDIMHYHISNQGHLNGSWSVARKNYLRIMRKPDDVNFITVLREPRSHFLSYYYYYLNPENKLSIEDFLAKPRNDGDHFGKLSNPLASEFGVTTVKQMKHLIANELPSFKLIFLTERFDEGLMVLRRLLGWNMIDMTYITLNETKPGLKRWDGKTFVKEPSFDDLPEKVRKEIDELTMLDQLLYTAAQEEYAKRLQPMSNVIDADLEEFNQLQDVVNDYLNANNSSKANALYRTNNVYKDRPSMNPF